MIKAAPLAAAVLSAMLAGTAGAADLTILHVNDTHARYVPLDRFGGTCPAEQKAENKCSGGFAHLAAKVKALKGPDSLVLHAGDTFQGSLYHTLHKSKAPAAVMPLVGFDVMTVGNHEFDDGPAELAAFAAAVPFPLVSANLDTGADPDLAGRITSHVVLERNGAKVAVIGAVTEDLPILSQLGPHIRVKPVAETLKPLLAELKAQGVERVVLLAHTGLETDRAIARAVDGVDVIVGGHSHSLLSNTADKAAGPYPLVETSPSGQPVLIVQAGDKGRWLGRLEVDFDANGVPVRWSGNPEPVTAADGEDPAVAAAIAALSEPLKELMARKVGEAAAAIDGDRAKCRFGECAMGNMVTQAILDSGKAMGIQVVISNGGDVRGGLPAGTITAGAVLDALPFPNTMATMELTGAEIVEALENGVSRADNPQAEGTGRFPQVAGLRFAWNATLPAGQRVSAVEVQGADGRFAPIDPAASYKVATNNFLRGGGDGYAVFRDKARNAYDHGPNLNEVLLAWIAANSPLQPVEDGRIRRIK